MNQFFKKYKTWFGVLNVVIIGIAFPIYLYCLSTPKPILRFFLADPEVVVLTNNKIDSFLVSYKNRDFTKENTNMVSTTVRIKNASRADIRVGDYTSEPFGIKVKGCKIIKVEMVKDEQNHLTKILNPQILDSVTIRFDKIAFDHKEEVSFNMYLTYKWFHRPVDTNFIVFGKITGAEPFELVHEGSDDSAFLDIIEIIGIFIGAEASVLIPYILLVLYFTKRSRKRQITKRLNPDEVRDLNTIELIFIDIYVDLGKRDFFILIKGLFEGDAYLSREKALIDAYEKVNKTRKGRILFIFPKKLKYKSPFSMSYKLLMEKELLKEEDGKFTMTSELKNEVEKILMLYNVK